MIKTKHRSLLIPIIIAENPVSPNYSMFQYKSKMTQKLQFVTPEFFIIIADKERKKIYGPLHNITVS